MTTGRLSVFAGALLSFPFVVATVARPSDLAEPAHSIQAIQLAQAPTPEEEKKKREREQKGPEKGPPPAPKGQPQPPPKASKFITARAYAARSTPMIYFRNSAWKTTPRMRFIWA